MLDVSIAMLVFGGYISHWSFSSFHRMRGLARFLTDAGATVLWLFLPTTSLRSFALPLRHMGHQCQTSSWLISMQTDGWKVLFVNHQRDMVESTAIAALVATWHNWKIPRTWTRKVPFPLWFCPINLDVFTILRKIYLKRLQVPRNLTTFWLWVVSHI